MGKNNPTKKSQVKDIAWRLFETTGRLPSRNDIMAELGGGSARDISAELAEWKSDLADWVYNQRHRPELPDAVWRHMTELWDVATTHAHQAALAALTEKEQALAEREQAAKTAVAEAKDELAAVSSRLRESETEIHRLSTALDEYQSRHDACERQRNDVERELALAIRAKEECGRESARLLRDLEKMRDAHRAEISELHQSHERDNDRWLKVIDEARQETRAAEQKAEKRAAHVEALQAELLTLKQEHAQAMLDAEKKAELWKARHDAQAGENRKLDKQLQAAQVSLEECRDQLKTLRDKEADARTQAASAQATVKQQRLQIESLENRLNKIAPPAK